jgi:hypothetical protein
VIQGENYEEKRKEKGKGKRKRKMTTRLRLTQSKFIFYSLIIYTNPLLLKVKIFTAVSYLPLP